jgi:hypothetical protein
LAAGSTTQPWSIHGTVSAALQITNQASWWIATRACSTVTAVAAAVT